MSSEFDVSAVKTTIKDRGITEQCQHSSCQSFALEDGIDAEGNVACPSCGRPFRVKVLDGAIWTVWRDGLEQGDVDIVEMPELQAARQERFKTEYGLGDETAAKLSSTEQVGNFFESLAEATEASTAATFVADVLLGELHYRDMTIDAVEPSDCTGLVGALSDDDVTWRAITPVVRKALDEGRPIDTVFSDSDIGKTDDDTLDEVVSDVIESNSGAVADYRDGKEEAINSLIGAVMEATNGQADASEARERLIEQISS